jgi:hypothetical protein
MRTQTWMSLIRFLSLPSLSAARAPSFVLQWGSAGSGPGEFSSRGGVAVDGSGFVYVADQDNHQIQKFFSRATPATRTTRGALKAPDR